MKKFSIKNNIFAYLSSMRWYCAFIPVMAGLLGIIFSNTHLNIFKEIIILSILLIGWGVNQVMNDCLGLPEDRLNAPQRAMVTGRLNIRFALVTSFVLFLMGLLLTYQLNSQAIIIYLFIFVLNLVYERAKRMPLLGNIIFGLLITPCIYYAAMCLNAWQLRQALLDSRLATLAILVWLINFVLCFFSDFKDFEGDKKTNVRTLVVIWGIHKAKYLSFILITIPFLCLYYFLKLSSLFPCDSNGYFLIMISFTFLIFLYTAIIFFKYPQGKSTYYSLKWIVLGVLLFEASLIGLAKPILAIILFIFNFIYIKLIFSLYRNYLA